MTVAGILYLIALTFKIEIWAMLDIVMLIKPLCLLFSTVAKLHAFEDKPSKIV